MNFTPKPRFLVETGHCFLVWRVGCSCPAFLVRIPELVNLEAHSFHHNFHFQFSEYSRFQLEIREFSLFVGKSAPNFSLEIVSSMP